MPNFIKFIQYHNAVPIALSILLLGGGAAFAASDPSAVYSKSEKVVSVDNTYLVHTDLSQYSPTAQIVSVVEDSDNYFVSYRIATIDVNDAVWKDVVRDEVMQVSKSDLGPYRDLGVYVTEKLKDVVARELQRLKETQVAESAHVGTKVIATEYGGLIGKFLDTTTEELPGYTPVVQPEPVKQFVEVPAPSMESPAAAAVPSAPATQPTAQPVVPAPVSSSVPTLKVLGNNPAEIPVGSTYSDLGAVLTSTPIYYAIHVFVGDAEVQQVALDTSKPAEYVITYKATNEAGETGEISRRVKVIDPNAAASTQGSTAESSTTPPVAP